MTNNLQKRKSKLNNKKGFSMVELLVAVALIAIIVPVLINGFIHAAKLNYRSRVQQRVDNVATNIYEELANVEYAELQKYFSDNGWTIEQTGVVGTYNATLSSDDVDGEIGNYQVNVTVQEYSKDYIVPDLNLIGVHSAYLTLEDEINEMDSIVENRLIQAIKSDDKVKTAIKNDAASRINETYGTNLNATNIDSSRIVVSCTIDKTKISKQTSVEVGVKDSQFVADYKVSYRYPAAQPNPDGDSSDLGVGYSYSHRLNGKWVSVSNTINVRETLKKVSESEYGNYQFIMEGIDSSASIKANGMDAHTMFVYYNPLNKLDWIDIKSNDNTAIHNVYFIEQGVEKDGNGNSVFALKYDNVDSKKSNFKGSFPQVDPHFTQLQQGSTYIKLYSNNTTIAKNGIPDSIYESTDGKVTMYRVSVEVVSDSNMFANVTGSFKAGGGSVGNFPS